MDISDEQSVEVSKIDKKKAARTVKVLYAVMTVLILSPFIVAIFVKR